MAQPNHDADSGAAPRLESGTAGTAGARDTGTTGTGATGVGARGAADGAGTDGTGTDGTGTSGAGASGVGASGTGTAQSTIEIAAPAERVYELVADVTRMGAWAAEVQRHKWLNGADGPAVGAWFRGVNRHGNRWWSKRCKVVAADPGRRFEFHAYTAGLPHASWRYDIEPTPTGCRVIETTRRISPRLLTNLVNRIGLGVADRDAHNQRNIERTLTQLKTYAEQAE